MYAQHLYWRKQVTEVYKQVHLKISEIHRKTSLLNFLFSKISRLGLGQVFSSEFCKIFKNIFYTGHLQATASGLAQLV